MNVVEPHRPVQRTNTFILVRYLSTLRTASGPPPPLQLQVQSLELFDM